MIPEPTKEHLEGDRKAKAEQMKIVSEVEKLWAEKQKKKMEKYAKKKN